MRRDDAELVRQTLAGKQCAFAELVSRYRGVVWGVAYHYLGDFEDAQDAAQEAFVHAYLHLTELREADRFAPWLRRTTMNRCANMLRRRGDRLLSLDGVEERAVARTASRAGELGERVATRMMVQQALGRLSEKTRLTVTLFYLSGYSHAEIARFLEIPVNTVRSRLQHAKKQLREEMMIMVTDTLSQGKPAPEWTRQVVEEAMRRGGEALQKHARGDAVRFYDEALAALAKAEPGAEQRRLEMEALLQKRKAIQYSWSHEETIDLLQRALAIAEEINDRKTQADIRQSLGVAYANRREMGKSVACYQEAREAYRELGDALGQGECLLSLGARCLYANEIAAGRRYYEQALPLFEQADSRDWAAVCRAMLDMLAEVGEERFATLLAWTAVCDVLENTAGVVRFAGQPGFQVTRRDDGAPGALFIGSVFWQLSHLRTFLDTGVPVGGSWSGDAVSFSLQPLRATVTVRSASERVTVPAGTFERCLLAEQVTSESDLPDEGPERTKELNRIVYCGRRRAWYAPGIGLVQLHVERADGSEVLIQLTEYAVPGASDEYLPLAVGNAWAYGWANVPAEYVAKEAYRVTAQKENIWYLEHYAYAYRT